MSRNKLDRRTFLAAGATATGLLYSRPSLALGADPAAKKSKLKKAVKYAMIAGDASIEDKLNLVNDLGFLGVEMDSPSDIDFPAAAAASKKTGVAIHGIIDSVHWQIRLSDPSPAVREKAVAALRGALQDAHTVGATTVLLVPGKVSDPQNENFDQVWERSSTEVRKLIPEAKQLGVKIAIEVVWNDFITTKEQLVKYVDQFNDPSVGAYFDCSNMVKYGVPPAEWIRALGERMLKFDFKGYSHQKKWVPIGEGDENWPDVLAALAEIGYDGWATAEVKGGGRQELADVSARMDRVLGLTA